MVTQRACPPGHAHMGARDHVHCTRRCRHMHARGLRPPPASGRHMGVHDLSIMGMRLKGQAPPDPFHRRSVHRQPPGRGRWRKGVTMWPMATHAASGGLTRVREGFARRHPAHALAAGLYGPTTALRAAAGSTPHPRTPQAPTGAVCPPWAPPCAAWLSATPTGVVRRSNLLTGGTSRSEPAPP